MKLVKSQYVNERRQYELQAALLRAEVEYLEEKQRRQHGESAAGSTGLADGKEGSSVLPAPTASAPAPSLAPATPTSPASLLLASLPSSAPSVSVSAPASTPVSVSVSVSVPSTPSVGAEDSKCDWIVGSMHDGEPSVKIELVHTFEHDSAVCTTGFSPDKKLFATGCNCATHVFDVVSGEKR